MSWKEPWEAFVEGNRAKQLFERLLRADTEAEVIGILKTTGYWDDPAVWRFYGDQPENWATVGNQQSRAEQALIEKATNSIDTKLIAAARLAGLPIQGAGAPQSLFRARDLLFGEQLRDIEKLSNSITIAATGARRRPSITIVDDGEGQTPSDMPNTILSLHRGNKNSIPFVQGKFKGQVQYGRERRTRILRRRPQCRARAQQAEPFATAK
jgi:hypothetical protein